MLSNIPLEISAALLAILAAVIGYAFREYRNRARPFFHITRIDGTTIRKSDQVTVAQEIQDNLKGSFFIKEFPPVPSLRDLDERWINAYDVKINWPKAERKIQSIPDTKSDEELQDQLYEALHLNFLNRMLLHLFVLDKIHVGSALSNVSEKIPIYDDEEYKGTVWICFPERSVQFGSNFKTPAIRAKCQPFLNIVRTLDRDKLLEVFRQTSNLMQSEYQSALQVEQPLHDLRNENSRWVFYSYFANLGRYPVIIQRVAEIVIKDPRTGTFKEICYLALVKEGSVTDTDVPIVVKPGEDVAICFITQKIQKDMQLGKAIRESYERGLALCRIGVKLNKIGLFKSQQVWSSKVVFKKEQV